MNQDEQLVSLIIPMHNAQQYIRTCVECVKRQSYRNLEVIFINDGSTDNTIEICKKYIKNMFNVRLITIENQGVSAARNVGLDNAKGEYIAFADVDDYFSDDYIEFMMKLIKTYNADIAMCNLKKCNKAYVDNNYYNSKCINISMYSSTEALERISYQKKLSGAPVGKLISKRITNHIRFDREMSYYEDYIYVCDVVRISQKIVFGDSIKYLYVQHKGSTTHEIQKLKCMQSWRILVEHLNNYIDNYPEISNCFYSKGIAVSINLFRHFYNDMGRDESSIKEYIKNNCIRVIKDSNNKMLRRILALLLYMNIDCTMYICSKGLVLLEKMHIYV